MASSTYGPLLALAKEVRREYTGASTRQITRYFRQTFQNLPAWGSTATVQILRSSHWLTGVWLVFDVSAISVSAGSVAFEDDITNGIQQLLLTLGSQQIMNVDGRTMSIANQVTQSAAKLQGTEASTGLNKTLVQRTALAGNAQRFKIYIPGPWMDSPFPIAAVSADLIMQITLGTLQQVTEGGGTYTSGGLITSAYVLTQFVETVADEPTSSLDAFVMRVRNSGQVPLVYRDFYSDKQPIANGTTTSTVQMSQLRGLVPAFFFYMLPVAATTTAWDNTPRDYQAITTFQFSSYGNTWPDQPLESDILQDVMGPEYGLENITSLDIYPILLDLGNSRERWAGDFFMKDSIGGRFFDGPGISSSTVTLTYPNPGANCTLYSVYIQVNALMYSADSTGRLQVAKLCT